MRTILTTKKSNQSDWTTHQVRTNTKIFLHGKEPVYANINTSLNRDVVANTSFSICMSSIELYRYFVLLPRTLFSIDTSDYTRFAAVNTCNSHLQTVKCFFSFYPSHHPPRYHLRVLSTDGRVKAIKILIVSIFL